MTESTNLLSMNSLVKFTSGKAMIVNGCPSGGFKTGDTSKIGGSINISDHKRVWSGLSWGHKSPTLFAFLSAPDSLVIRRKAF